MARKEPICIGGSACRVFSCVTYKFFCYLFVLAAYPTCWMSELPFRAGGRLRARAARSTRQLGRPDSKPPAQSV